MKFLRGSLQSMAMWWWLGLALVTASTSVADQALLGGSENVQDGRIALVRCEQLCGSPGSRADIYTMEPDGSRMRRLTRTKGWERSPDWSPSGRRLVFGCGGTRSNGGHLCTMRADGSQREPLTPSGSEDVSPDWGVNRQIVFVRVSSTADGVLWYQLVVIGIDGASERVLIEGPNRISDPHWSPDGSGVVYALSDPVQSDIHIASADGTTSTNLTESPAFETDPAWSPDGSTIAFSRYVDSRWRLFTIQTSGERELALPVPKGGLGSEWSPSGSRLLFTRLTNNRHPLFALNLRTQVVARLTGAFDTAAPSWKAR